MVIQKTSLVEIAMDRIKTYILENKLKENDKLPTEKEFIAKLQVSRTVVREALRSLESIGILKIKPGGGVFVGDSDFRSIKSILKHHYEAHGVKIRELVEIRKILELGALRLIIEKNLDVDFDYLESLNQEYYQAITHNWDTKKYDQLFHQHIIREADNETFYNFTEVIQEYFSLVKIDLMQSKKDLLASYKEHSEILAGLKNKNLEYSHKIMSVHFEPIFDYIYEMEGLKEDGTN
ncbi:FadR/GntR family transcriptional regulator [Oceanobacillus oncorhynchi]|uniref:FadR/GntR family transcriptional regulator n=1 Tax=Oceanobacillus oncorhynchi TaxID=545501 RepID=UPI0018674932|nr:GntR family transcriptional regulator [Oceanobacillus oncorhynchi]MDM8101285.1 GntR family transcriptional regulator [Oceanobacillus oncorhynchi]